MFENVRVVTGTLKRRYTITNLGNKRNPFAELIYIILAGQTNERLYQCTYRAFRRSFPTFDSLVGASQRRIEGAIRRGGLASQKARYVIGIVRRMKKDFGKVSLRRLSSLSTDDAEGYLVSLPGVGVKTARCVLMYALDREVFPLDSHCLRIMTRLGWITSNARRAEACAHEAQKGVPSKLRRNLHILLVMHGREVCGPQPRCEVCTIRRYCSYGKRQA